jgi:hypothetical protein
VRVDAEPSIATVPVELDLQMECETVAINNFGEKYLDESTNTSHICSRNQTNEQLPAVTESDAGESNVDSEVSSGSLEVQMTHAESVFYHDHHYTKKHPSDQKVSSRILSYVRRCMQMSSNGILD